jgi:hypothetical protein
VVRECSKCLTLVEAVDIFMILLSEFSLLFECAY